MPLIHASKLDGLLVLQEVYHAIANEPEFRTLVRAVLATGVTLATPPPACLAIVGPLNDAVSALADLLPIVDIDALADAATLLFLTAHQQRSFAAALAFAESLED
jgi:hypothetical protein